MKKKTYVQAIPRNLFYKSPWFVQVAEGLAFTVALVSMLGILFLFGV